MKTALSWMLAAGVNATVLAFSAGAVADEARPSASESRPRIGGHIGVATPYLVVSKETPQVIGKDSFLVLLNPIGLTVHASDKWAFDFEVVVATNVLKKETTGLIIDPGVIYKGWPVAVGLRVAHKVGDAPNVGFIPLVNKGFKLGDVTWFVEAAFPTFVRDNGVTFNAVAHTGIAF